MQTDPEFDVPCSQACDEYKSIYFETVKAHREIDEELIGDLDKRARTCTELLFALLNESAGIQVGDVAGRDFDSTLVYKRAHDLAHYLHAAPGIDEAERILGIAAIAWGRAG